MKSKTVQELKETEIGKISKDYEVVKLGEMLTLLKDGSHNPPKRVSTGIPFIAGATEIKYFDIDFSKATHITKEDYDEIHKKFEVEKDDILLTIVGTIGNVAIVKEEYLPFSLQRNIAILRPNKELHYSYLFYWLTSSFFKNILYQRGNRTAQPRFYLRELANTPIIIQPLEIQKKNTNFLLSIDQKIRNLQNQNHILEQMLQTIFQSWFVDFDGVTEWNDSELGKIPKGWEIKKIGDFISVEKGLSYKGKFLSTSGIPLINLGNIEKNGGFIENKIKHYTGEFKTKHIISSGDIVIANTDITQDRLVLGSPALTPPLDSKEIIFTHHIFAVRNNSDFRKYFLYYLLKIPNYHQHVVSYATGTTVLAIPKEAVLDFQFALPKDNLINKFDNIASSIQELFFKNNLSIQTLTKTRDALLPKLMSGEIRV